MHELQSGQDILAAQPVDSSTQRLLTDSYRFSSQHVHDRIEKFQDVIQADLDYLGVMVHCTDAGESNYQDDNPDSALSPDQLLLAKVYRGVAVNPVDKHAFDSDFIAGFLQKLGPTNHLKDHSGLDAAFELSHMKRILELDYAALPESHQTPESRLTEAYIREELALLWTPTAMARAANLPKSMQGLLANDEDPNIFTPEQLKTTTSKDRWKVVGARLAAEASELFSDIATSPTAKLDIQIEALTRSVDMRLRELRIQSGISTIKDKQAIHDEMKDVSDDETDRMVLAWDDPATRGQISTGKLYESFSIAVNRQEMFDHGQWNDSVRLALPREDMVSKELKPWINRDNVLVNLSSDIIVEDPNGNFKMSYQVKAMNPQSYAAKMLIREATKGKMIYPPERTEMIFLGEKVKPRG